MEATSELMNHPGVASILATGGNAMVKAAYSCGKPAMGVGAGNVPAYIEKTANIKQAVNDIVMSKSFDNGMICASEQAAIIDKEIYEVPSKYIGSKLYIRYDPTNNEEAFIFSENGERLERIVKVNKIDNSKLKRGSKKEAVDFSPFSDNKEVN